MNNGKKSASNASEYKFSWGHTIYHELMHLDPVIAAEEVWDVTYGACTVAKLANQNGCNYSPVLWDPPGWKSERGDPHSLINADSWAFFASGVYFQKAAKLNEPGRPLNDCGIYSGENLANFTYPGTEYDPEGILLSTEDAPPDIINLQVPPDPAPENTPPDDPSTPALPYTLSSLPTGLATPLNAEEYFATYVPAASSSVPPPASTTAPSASPPVYATGTCAFHLIETQTCGGDSNNLYAIVKLVDANKADIGDTPVNNDNPLGAPINAADLLIASCPIPSLLWASTRTIMSNLRMEHYPGRVKRRMGVHIATMAGGTQGMDRFVLQGSGINPRLITWIASFLAKRLIFGAMVDGLFGRVFVAIKLVFSL